MCPDTYTKPFLILDHEIVPFNIEFGRRNSQQSDLIKKNLKLKSYFPTKERVINNY